MKLLIVLSSLVCLAMSQHDHHKTLTAVSDHLFTLMDSNRDGTLSHEELHDTFLAFDENSDHRITEKEFYIELCGRDPEICWGTIGLFQVLDTLNENVLWETNLDRIFNLFDTNANKIIARSEFSAWMTAKLVALRSPTHH